MVVVPLDMSWHKPFLVSFMVFWAWRAGFAGHDEGLIAYNLSDFDTARVEFLQASALGDSRSQYMLGLIHERGFGVDRNPMVAMKWYRTSARQGHALAQYTLAMMHRKGLDTATRPRSGAMGVGGAVATPSQRLGIAYMEALKWFELAAEQGVADAQYNLGLMHATGNGIPIDFITAHLWWSVAVSSGSLEARHKLVLLEQLMTDEDLGKARELAMQWRDKH